MAKKPPEPCMFCGIIHKGDCNSSVKATKPTAKKFASRPVADVALPKDDIEFVAPPPPKSKFAASEHSAPERDLSYESALLALRPILSEKDQKWVDRQVAHPMAGDTEKRLIGWKERNGLA